MLGVEEVDRRGVMFLVAVSNSVTDFLSIRPLDA